MESASFSGFTHPDGIHLSVDGVGSMFRFWIGQGEIAKMSIPGAHVWSVTNVGQQYMVQMTATPLDPNALRTMDPLQLLSGHFQWETGYQKQSGNSVADESSMKILDGPQGMPVLSWISDRVLPASNQTDVNSPSRYLAMSTLVHDGMVVGFSVTGVGGGWDKKSLQELSAKIALSYDRSDPWKSVEPERPNIADGLGDPTSELKAYRKGLPLTTEGLFELVTDEVFRDGKVDAQENRLALLLASAMGLSEARAKEIAARSKARYDSGKLGDDRHFEPKQLYARVLRYVLADGKVDSKERKLVEGLLKVLGLTPEDHRRILAGVLSDPASIQHSVPGTLVRDLIKPPVDQGLAAPRRSGRLAPAVAPTPSAAAPPAVAPSPPTPPVAEPPPLPMPVRPAAPAPDEAPPPPPPEPEPETEADPEPGPTNMTNPASPVRKPLEWAKPGTRKKKADSQSGDNNSRPTAGAGSGEAISPTNDLAFMVSSGMAFFGFFATLLYYVLGINIFEPSAEVGQSEGSPTIFPILTFLSASFALWRRWALKKEAGG